MLKRFIRNTSGNVAMMFGLLTVPLIAATGAAIDFSRAYEQRMVVQDALDAAALAANRLIGLATDDEIRAEATAFYLSNVAGRIDIPPDFEMTIDGGQVLLTTNLQVPTSILGIIDIDFIYFDLSSLTVSGAVTYEVVLVLDNSGSMSGSKIDTLKLAALDLINSLFELSITNPQPDPVMIGIVPFAASVNVGPTYANAAWMDTGGIAANAALNFQTNTTLGNTTPYSNTFALWNGITNADWGGCVEARPYPYALTDAAPTGAVPATLFAPMFAPDEPGGAGSPKSGFNNSYLSDTAGTCVNTTTTTSDPCAGKSGWQLTNCRNTYGYTSPWTVPLTLTDLQLQERTCKYQNVTVGSAYDGMGQGPNRHCTTAALMTMTDDQTALVNQVNAMVASGYTNVTEGIMWGWRLLSPTEPFTQGRPYGGVNGNRKIMIVMTDGANTYVSRSNMNRSEYMAYNFVINGVLGTTSTNNDTIVEAMNDYNIEACENLHETEIIVYTVAFQLPADEIGAEEILLNCASSPSKAFTPDNNDELIAAFHLIAQDIATLRIAE